MARPKRKRLMENPPTFKGFMPIGLPEDKIPVVINFEEYEAIRLSDFELLNQVDAANIMNISRPTFTRIYESARRKVALAFIEGTAIIFEGGKVYFDSEWYSCNHCGSWFNNPVKDQETKDCPLCGSTNIEQYKEEESRDTIDEIFVCPKCGIEKKHSQDFGRRDVICPECNCLMLHKCGRHHHRNRTRNCK